MAKKPDKVTFRIDLRNLHLDNEKNKLAEGSLENVKHVFEDEIKVAPENNWTDNLEVELEDFIVPKVAYNLTEMVYLFFQHDQEAIPYTKEIDGMKAIDVEPIQSI